MNDLKIYRNKKIGEFTSIPIRLMDDSSQLDSLYMSSHFYKLRTKPVAAIRKSKHYATTLAAWQKKLLDVDTSDLAAVAKTLRLNVEVFNPLASSEPQTLFSGGGRSKRKAQLLKVKKGVYKPMKAGAIIDELPPDMLRDVVGRLDPEDKSALLRVSRGVRQDTMAVLPAQGKLWAAAKSLNVEHAKTALEEGARVNKIDPSVGMNALKMIEGRNGSSALYEFLERQGGKPLNLEQINKHLVRCVKTVAGLDDYLHDPGLVKEALLDGADPNTRTKYNSYNRVDDKDIEGSLLHVLTVRVIESISSYHLGVTADVIKDLKSFGIDMNQVDVNPEYGMPSGLTALHYACWVGEDDRKEVPNAGIRPSIVKALLEAGIDVNKQNSRGCTALHDLTHYGGVHDEDYLLQEDISLARLLLSHGADVSITDENGKTVVDYTEEEDFVTYDPDMFDVLIRATETREDFIRAVKDGNVESVKQFLQQGVPVNVNTYVNDYPGDDDLDGSKPILFWAFDNFLEDRIPKDDAMAIVRLLLDHPRIDVNAVDWRGETAIMNVLGDPTLGMMQPWRVDVVRMLIAKGIDLGIKNKDGANIWDILIKGDHVERFGRHDNEEIIRLVAEALDIPYENSYTTMSESEGEGSRKTRSRDESEYDSDRSVRQRVGGGGNTGVEVDFNADYSRGTSYSEDDASLAKAIEVLFGKMKSLKLKQKLRFTLRDV